MPLNDWKSAARFGVPGVVMGLALSWAVAGERGLQAQGAAPTPAANQGRPGVMGDPSGTIAFTTPVTSASGNAQLLYLIDTRARAFAVYRVDKGTVKLEAARQYQWDLKLADYNNVGLEPSAIEAAVKAGGLPKR